MLGLLYGVYAGRSEAEASLCVGGGESETQHQHHDIMMHALHKTTGAGAW